MLRKNKGNQIIAVYYICHTFYMYTVCILPQPRQHKVHVQILYNMFTTPSYMYIYCILCLPLLHTCKYYTVCTYIVFTRADTCTYTVYYTVYNVYHSFIHVHILYIMFTTPQYMYIYCMLCLPRPSTCTYTAYYV